MSYPTEAPQDHPAGRPAGRSETGYPGMPKGVLKQKMREAQKRWRDPVDQQVEMMDLLLDYVNDPVVTRLYMETEGE